jgi:hypothetical protein
VVVPFAGVIPGEGPLDCENIDMTLNASPYVHLPCLGLNSKCDLWLDLRNATLRVRNA